jgi:hypothetical protein
MAANGIEAIIFLPIPNRKAMQTIEDGACMEASSATMMEVSTSNMHSFSKFLYIFAK